MKQEKVELDFRPVVSKTTQRRRPCQTTDAVTRCHWINTNCTPQYHTFKVLHLAGSAAYFLSDPSFVLAEMRNLYNNGRGHQPTTDYQTHTHTHTLGVDQVRVYLCKTQSKEKLNMWCILMNKILLPNQKGRLLNIWH